MATRRSWVFLHRCAPLRQILCHARENAAHQEFAAALVQQRGGRQCLLVLGRSPHPAFSTTTTTTTTDRRNVITMIDEDELFLESTVSPSRLPANTELTSHQIQETSAPTAIAHTTTTIAPRKTRNQDLENIVRQGIVYLNQTALAIQQNPHAQKNLFKTNRTSTSTGEELDGYDDDEGPNARQLYEEHRILTTAQDALEHLCGKNPYHAFICASTGDPITLLRVEVNETNTHATLYWSLPHSVLTQIPDHRQQLLLQRAMAKRVQPYEAELLHKIHASLMKSSYSPRVRLVAADVLEVQEMMDEMDDDE
jgi:hypothetical protein